MKLLQMLTLEHRSNFCIKQWNFKSNMRLETDFKVLEKCRVFNRTPSRCCRLQ